MSARSNLAEVRNPIMALPAMAKLKAILRDTGAIKPVAALLKEIAEEARAKAELCWRKHKSPMAVYWKAVSVYSRHIRVALTRP